MTIAAASSLRPMVEQLSQKYNSIHGGEEIRCVYGASGTIFTQIVGGAPFNIFLSADPNYLEQLQKRGKVNSPIDTLAWGTLGFLSQREAVLSCNTILLPHPGFAPFGKAAQSYLNQIGFSGLSQFAGNAAQVVHQMENGWGDGALTSWPLIHQMSHAREIQNGPRVPIAVGAIVAHPENDRLIEFISSDQSQLIWRSGQYQVD